MVRIPALDFEFEGGLTSGDFQTVNSLARRHCQRFATAFSAVISSDLSGAAARVALFAFIDRFDALKTPAGMPWQLEFSDPLNLSYIAIDGSLAADTALRIEDFERQHQDDERHEIDPEHVDHNTVLVADANSLVPAAYEPEPTPPAVAAVPAAPSTMIPTHCQSSLTMPKIVQ
jgi:hypothetical protein